MLEKTGLYSLVPMLQLRKMSRNAALTPISTDESSYYMARSRAFLKRTIDKIVSKVSFNDFLESKLKELS